MPLLILLSRGTFCLSLRPGNIAWRTGIDPASVFLKYFQHGNGLVKRALCDVQELLKFFLGKTAFPSEMFRATDVEEDYPCSINLYCLLGVFELIDHVDY